MNRTGTILLAVLSLTAFSCSTGREVAPAREAPALAAPVAAAIPGADLTREDLEEIRAVAIRYCEEKKLEGWETYVQELRRGAIFMRENEEPRIGLWRIEEDDEGLTLVRWSADSLAYYKILNLAREEGRWIVTGDSYREEFLRPED